MSETDPIAAATERLSLALEALEAAVERRQETDRSEEALAVQIQALGADRARLASELDVATARSRGLETANRDVVERIDRAIAAIKDVLAREI
jgi:hypothetical protein